MHIAIRSPLHHCVVTNHCNSNYGKDKVTQGNAPLQVRPGLRIAVEPHGGHFWSSQGQVQRPLDVVSLRIDNQERIVNQLNDVLISPTNYMISFLRQRGWKLPKQTITIPNIIPEVEPEAEKVDSFRRLWQLATDYN